MSIHDNLPFIDRRASPVRAASMAGCRIIIGDFDGLLGTPLFLRRSSTAAGRWSAETQDCRYFALACRRRRPFSFTVL
ncbi:MAG: hypothetical protein ABSC32_17795 [Steroidobacteraceae bacterium]|jgi:hypothetical protein